MTGRESIPLNYAEAEASKSLRLASTVMFAMACVCVVNLGFDFLLIIAPQIGDSPSGFVTGTLVLACLLGFVAALVGMVTFLASKESRRSYYYGPRELRHRVPGESGMGNLIDRVLNSCHDRAVQLG